MNIKLPIVKSPNVEDHDLNKLNFHYLFDQSFYLKCHTSSPVKMCGSLFEQT